MNASRNTIAASVLFFAAAMPALADDITPDPYQAMPSTRTRAAVIAEYLAARAAGEMAGLNAEDSGSFQLARSAPQGGLSRAEVVAAVLTARRDGTLNASVGEDSGSFQFARSSGGDGRTDGVRLAGASR